MRIIAGSLRGREFHTPPGHRTHPMSDKIRGALFNILGELDGLSVLDAFAGSGALSFEAISHGARRVTAVEKDRAAHTVIDRNIKELGLEDQVHAVRANIGGWSLHNTEKKFDILFLDPPYDELQTTIMQKLVGRHLKNGGLAVLSYPGNTTFPELDGAKVVANKQYGDAQLVFYRKTS